MHVSSHCHSRPAPHSHRPHPTRPCRPSGSCHSRADRCRISPEGRQPGHGHGHLAQLTDTFGGWADAPTPAQPTPGPTAPTPAEPAPGPTAPTPSEPTPGPAAPSPAEPAPAPEAPTPAEPAPAPTPDSRGSAIGQQALSYGVDSPRTNPNTGTENWNGYCLGWVNQAINNNGGNVSELRTANARMAYEQALANGRIEHGDPPPGAIVFFPDGDPGGEGHVGIAAGDGLYRGTVPASENPTTIADRPIPNPDSVAWMLPYA